MVILQLLCLLLIIGLFVYLPWRLGNLFTLSRKRCLFILFAFMLISGIISMHLVARFDSALVSAYYYLAWTWLGAFVFLCCFMLVFEVANLIYAFSPVKAGWTIIALTAVVTAYSMFQATSFEVAYITIPIKGLEHEVRIVQISDVHLGVSRGEGYLTKIVSKTNELKPDFVAITGDLADSKAAISKNMFAAFRDMQAPGYYVFGNHEAYVGLDIVIKSLKENNITVLQNEVSIVNGIKLVGLNYMKADDRVYDPHQVTGETIKDILPSLDLSGGLPLLVLHHGPWGIEYLSDYGIDLVLAGHTHNGQIFPGNLLSKTVLFPYSKGLADYNGTYIYVSQGAGTFFPRMRLGTNNEINFITLVPV